MKYYTLVFIGFNEKWKLKLSASAFSAVKGNELDQPFPVNIWLVINLRFIAGGSINCIAFPVNV